MGAGGETKKAPGGEQLRVQRLEAIQQAKGVRHGSVDRGQVLPNRLDQLPSRHQCQEVAVQGG